jgi:hypothetical protein
MCSEELANESARVLVGRSRENEEVDKGLGEIDKLNAVANLLKYREETRKWRNKKVSLKHIQVGDLVLKRKKNANSIGKLQFAWEGPYIVMRSARGRAFSLKDEEGMELPHSWNVDNVGDNHRGPLTMGEITLS